MFDLDLRPYREMPVKLEATEALPEITFTAHMLAPSQSEVEGIVFGVRNLGRKYEDLQSATAEDVAADPFHPITLCRRLLVGWEGITAGGKHFPFTEENRDLLINQPMLASALINRWVEFATGAGLAGNSEALRKNGSRAAKRRSLRPAPQRLVSSSRKKS